MSIGAWDPSLGASEAASQLQPELLQRLAAYSRSEQLSDITQLLSGEEQQTLAGLMKVDHSEWHSTCDAMDSEELLHLIRFFAVAENLPGWEAGDKSPVIALAKILRKRGERLDRDMLLWLREINNNRFLPYGPL